MEAQKTMNDVRENILQVAIERMQQVGIRSVSVDDICHELGMSKKTFYVYFASKDDLVQAILQKHEQKVAHDLDNALSKRTYYYAGDCGMGEDSAIHSEEGFEDTRDDV